MDNSKAFKESKVEMKDKMAKLVTDKQNSDDRVRELEF
jgi:hypothetical protein